MGRRGRALGPSRRTNYQRAPVPRRLVNTMSSRAGPRGAVPRAGGCEGWRRPRWARRKGGRRPGGGRGKRRGGAGVGQLAVEISGGGLREGRGWRKDRRRALQSGTAGRRGSRQFVIEPLAPRAGDVALWGVRQLTAEALGIMILGAGPGPEASGLWGPVCGGYQRDGSPQGHCKGWV